jgi:hypothetical protein
MTPERKRRNKMIRNSLFALAAAVTTLSVFAATLAAVTGGSGVMIA